MADRSHEAVNCLMRIWTVSLCDLSSADSNIFVCKRSKSDKSEHCHVTLTRKDRK